jgi:hypothetical protein
MRNGRVVASGPAGCWVEERADDAARGRGCDCGGSARLRGRARLSFVESDELGPWPHPKAPRCIQLPFQLHPPAPGCIWRTLQDAGKASRIQHRPSLHPVVPRGIQRDHQDVKCSPARCIHQSPAASGASCKMRDAPPCIQRSPEASSETTKMLNAALQDASTSPQLHLAHPARCQLRRSACQLSELKFGSFPLSALPAPTGRGPLP